MARQPVDRHVGRVHMQGEAGLVGNDRLRHRHGIALMGNSCLSDHVLPVEMQVRDFPTLAWYFRHPELDVIGQGITGRRGLNDHAPAVPKIYVPLANRIWARGDEHVRAAMVARQHVRDELPPAAFLQGAERSGSRPPTIRACLRSTRLDLWARCCHRPRRPPRQTGEQNEHAVH